MAKNTPPKRRGAQVGDRFTWTDWVDGAKQTFVGEAVEVVGSREAKDRGLTPHRRRGAYLLLRIDGGTDVVGKFRAHVKPLVTSD